MHVERRLEHISSGHRHAVAILIILKEKSKWRLGSHTGCSQKSSIEGDFNK